MRIDYLRGPDRIPAVRYVDSTPGVDPKITVSVDGDYLYIRRNDRLIFLIDRERLLSVSDEMENPSMEETNEKT